MKRHDIATIDRPAGRDERAMRVIEVTLAAAAIAAALLLGLPR